MNLLRFLYGKRTDYHEDRNPQSGCTGHEAIENSQWPENDSSLNGDVSMGDNFGSLILMKPKPVAS